MFGETFIDIIDSLKNTFINKIVKYVWYIWVRVLVGPIQKTKLSATMNTLSAMEGV
jgi:hypothetical protein